MRRFIFPTILPYTVYLSVKITRATMTNSPAPTQSSAVRLNQWLKILSISRLFRWVVYFFMIYGIYTNWHQAIEPGQLAQKYAYPDSKFIAIDGMEVHCRITGKGIPILLLHDAQSSLHTWQTWTDSLSQKYKVISVDLPGFGLTGPHPQGSYSAFMYASFLDSLVQKLDLKKFNLVGNGLGAQIAWHYAAEAQQRIDHMVLMNAPGFEPKRNTWILVLARTPVINRIIRRVTPRYFIRLMLEDIYADNIKVTDSLVQQHFDLFLRVGNRKAFTDRASVRDNRPPVEIIEKIKVPTLILWGAEDTRISPENAYKFHQKIKPAVLKIYRNTGHWPQEENPVQSAKDVKDFLEGNF